jgi:putative ABC transport system ATP-binding protein
MYSCVSLKNLHKSFKDGSTESSVLNGVDLNCERGEIVAIMGESGSGKTTLVNTIAGIEPIDSGRITINETRIDELSERKRTLFRRKNIGMVFQFFNLIPTLTVRENIQFPLRINQKNTDGAVEWYLDELGINDQADQYPGTLSGGERQRVSIARALIHEPDLIIADEPTGNLDTSNSETVLDTFQDQCEQRDVAVILSTHSENCASIADRKFKLKNGQLNKP